MAQIRDSRNPSVYPVPWCGDRVLDTRWSVAKFATFLGTTSYTSGVLLAAGTRFAKIILCGTFVGWQLIVGFLVVTLSPRPTSTTPWMGQSFNPQAVSSMTR